MRTIEKAISDRLHNNVDNLEKDTLILGVGNYLMGDEGIGVHFIHYLIENDVHYDHADILDGGVGGFALMSYFDIYDKVIFIDATMDGKPVGTVSQLRPRFASDFPNALSAHDFGLKDMIESMYLLGKVPDLHLITISIAEIKPMTLELSKEVKDAIPVVQVRLNDLIETLEAERF